MWVHLNVFHHRVAALGAPDVSEEQLARLCAAIKEGCDAHVGITASTFYRDEAWSLYQIGAAVECVDQTTRLLDAKFLASPGSAADASYWTAVLRSAAGYRALRRLGFGARFVSGYPYGPALDGGCPASRGRGHPRPGAELPAVRRLGRARPDERHRRRLQPDPRRRGPRQAIPVAGSFFRASGNVLDLY
jgi:hypothetical protein